MRRKGLILAYHRINSSHKDPLALPVEDFRAQMSYFRESGYSALTLEEFSTLVTQGDIPQKTLVITFDDGYRDNYLFAFPILKDHGFRGTFFLTADYIGTNDAFPMDKDKGWDNVADEDLPLTWKQVFEMKDYGMEFGSHTCSHRNLDELSDKEVVKEIVESKRYLEQRLQLKVRSFCYPSGRYNQKVKEMVREAGYTAAVVTPRQGQRNEDLYSLKRVGIYSGDTGWRFQLKISPFFRVVRDLGLIYQVKKLRRSAK